MLSSILSLGGVAASALTASSKESGAREIGGDLVGSPTVCRFFVFISFPMPRHRCYPEVASAAPAAAYPQFRYVDRNRLKTRGEASMPRPKGLPKTGGRKKGTRNRVPGPATRARNAVAEAIADAVLADMSPLQYMLAVFRDPTVDERRRDAMAMAAAPYVHAKLAMTSVKAEVHSAPAAEGQRLTPEEYSLWARQKIREAFGLPPLTIEHKAEPTGSAEPIGKVEEAVDAAVGIKAVEGDVEAASDAKVVPLIKNRP
jgi:hypothetical protein